VSHDGASIALDASRSSDSDGQIVRFEWFEEGRLVATGAAPTVTLRLGSHTLLLRVTDNQGGTNDDVVLATVQDTHPPVIQMVVSPTELWPPNHEMRLVSHAVMATDACDPAPTLNVSVVSNEPENGLGDGDTAPDWLVQRLADATVDIWLRAERSGLGNGRIYTIRAAASDRSANTTAEAGKVSVPHNQ
jgi:hypothetical protein